MRNDAFELLTLGRLALVAADGSVDASLATRRRKLALLAVLANAGRPLSRGALAEMFWGDQDEERARHSLSDALSHLRRVLGRDAIAARQTDVWLTADGRVTMDAQDLMAAAAAHNAERVVALYAGPFMDGVYVAGSCTFERWTALERDRLERLFLSACEARCFALARGREWDQCAALSARWLGIAPLSVDAALYRLNALKAPLTRDAFARALAEYDRLVRRLREEYELTPDPCVTALASDIAACLRAVLVSAPAGAPAAVAPASIAGEQELQRAPSPTPRRLGRVPRWAAVVGSIAITLLLAAPTGRARGLSPYATPVVAVAPLRVMGPDRSLEWIGDGVAQLIASDLAGTGAVTVVPPERVRATAVGAGSSDEATRALGEELGATWIVDGGLVRGGGMFMIDVSVRETSSGRVVALFTVTGRDIGGVALEAASRLRAATGSAQSDHSPS